jgi:hypothetical protein
MTTYPYTHRIATPPANFYHLLAEELFDPALRTRPMPVRRRPAVPVPLAAGAAGALGLTAAALAIWGLGLFAYAMPLFLMASALLMPGLAVAVRRPLFLVVAVLHLPLMLGGLYALPLSGWLPLYGLHLLLVGVALFDRSASADVRVQRWGGVELAVLALCVVTAL